MQAHHCAVLVNESLLNLHRRHYTEALAATREEPLLSPYADSILAISLQACTIIPEVVEAAHEMYPRLAKRGSSSLSSFPFIKADSDPSESQA